MRRQGRVLIVDDEERWRSALKATLERVDLSVDTVATMDDALEMINQNFHHVYVLDIRMNDGDQSNNQGMDLLKYLHEQRLAIGEVIQVYILSAFGTKDQMRESFRDYNVADFMAKDDFDNIEFRKQIHSIFEPDFATNTLGDEPNVHIEINLDLDILWQDSASQKIVVQNLTIGGNHVGNDPQLQSRMSAELDDLLCRLFWDAKSIVVKPIHSGMSDAAVISVQPFFDEGGGRPVIVKFGSLELIDDELNNFERYVRNFIASGGNSTVLDHKRTQTLGGIKYSLIGASGSDPLNFGEYYYRASADQIKEIVKQVFHDTCAFWYSNPGPVEPHKLGEYYASLLGISEESLQRGREGLKKVSYGADLNIEDLNNRRSFKNPFLALPRIVDTIFPTYFSTVHGDLNESNILIDDECKVWLIDFYRTGKGHILTDLAELDSIVRFKLLTSASMDERLLVEDALLQATSVTELGNLQSEFDCENANVCKAYSICAYLRQIAAQIMRQNPNSSIEEYYTALFYFAINTTRFNSSYHITHREHALLSASLIADRIGG